MKPPLPRIESAVPRTLQARHEIAKAVRTLTAPNRDDPLRQRRAEIAAIRQDLEALAREIPRAFKEASALVKAELRAALAKKYNPGQPRVPAGSRDGGQWTNGDESGGGASDVSSDVEAGDVAGRRVHYAQADIRTDAADGSDAHVTTLQDTQNHLRNLYDVVLTALHSRMGDILNFFDSHDLDIKIIGAGDVSDNSRKPVPFTDSDNEQIYAQGNPLLRPIGLPPELYAQAGLAVRSWVQIFTGLEQGGGTLDDPDAANARSMALALIASNILLPLAPGGSLDAERFDWTYVRDYRRYQNIMIGVYGAAAGMSEDQVLSMVDFYATIVSRFGAKEERDEVYTHSAKQDVADTRRGYELYQSGRVRLER
jgi:hypothetical protein